MPAESTGEPSIRRTPPPIPAKPRELRSRLSNNSRGSPAPESCSSRGSSASSPERDSLANSTSTLNLAERAPRKIPENYYGKPATAPSPSPEPIPAPAPVTVAAKGPPPLPPRSSTSVAGYYGQSTQAGILPAQVVTPSEFSADVVHTSAIEVPAPPPPQAPAPYTVQNLPPPPVRIRRDQVNQLTLATTAVNQRPPAAGGPALTVKKGLASLSLDTKYTCVGGTSCAIYSSDTLEPVWTNPTDKVTASVQVGTEVWLGTRDGRICIVDPRCPGFLEENGKHYRRPITNLWYDDGFVIALGADGKVSVWSTSDFRTPVQVHRVAPSFKCATYSSPFLWVMKGRQVNVYDPLLKNGGFHALPQSFEFGERSSSTVGEYSCGCAGPLDGITALGHNDGTVSFYRNFDLKATLTLGYSGVLSIVKAGRFYWIGLRTGKLLVVDIAENRATLIKEWKAHSGPVTMLASCQGTGLVLSGSLNEPVGVWEAGLSQDTRDLENQQLLDQNAAFKELKVQIFTWNVGCAKPRDVNDHVFWREFNPKSLPDIVVFGFQEVVELDNKSKTAKTIMKAGEELDSEHRAWRQFLTLLLEEDYVRVADRALVGLYSCAFISAKYVGALANVSTEVVKTGFGGLHGNKGATILRFDMFDSTLSFVNVHLAAGQSGALQRNKDAEIIVNGGPEGSQRPVDHEYCFFFGDTNYRINTVRENAVRLISTKSWDKLYAFDQLGRQLTRNPTFVLAGFQEMPIRFPPTYKYDVGTNRYDTSDKQRIPSWCDRVLYRGSRVEPVLYDCLDALESDHRPVMGTFKIQIKMYSPDDF